MHSLWTFQGPPLYPIHLCLPQKVSIFGRHTMASICNCKFHTGLQKLFLNSCLFILLYDGLNIAGNEASSFQTPDSCKEASEKGDSTLEHLITSPI